MPCFSQSCTSHCVQVLKRRLAERKDDTEQCVLLLRKLGEPDDTLVDRWVDSSYIQLGVHGV
jgi:hypothetical protein